MSDLVIAIDGPAGSGKSTVARAVAALLGWSFLDTGAMYRAVTREALFRGIDVHDAAAVAALAEEVTLTTLPRVTVNGRDVEDEIRSDGDQRRGVRGRGQSRGARGDGRRDSASWPRPNRWARWSRDATSRRWSFPTPRSKIFLTASLEERARRRGDESEDSVARRDEADSTRQASPLRQADDALVLDTTGRDVDDVAQEIVQWLKHNLSR